MRLVEQPEGNWQNRVHFFGVASLPMRQILVDHARMRADKRGGMQQRMTLGEPLLSAENNSIDILALQEAMERLKERDWQMARVWVGDELSKTP